MFTFPLISSKKPILYIILLIIWNSGILLAIIAFFFWDKPICWTFLQIFLICFVIWIVGNILIKSYIIAGTISIGSDSIKVISDTEINFDIDKTKKILIKYGGAQGDSYGAIVGFLRSNDGSKNLIAFEYEDKTYKYGFLVTKKNFLNSIHWILKNWKENEVEFKILDLHKKDITSKLLNQLKDNSSR